MIVFRLALYSANGALVRTSDAFPLGDPPDPQDVADRCARAADAGCTYQVGTFLVWVDHNTQPAQRIEQAPNPDGERSFGARARDSAPIFNRHE